MRRPEYLKQPLPPPGMVAFARKSGASLRRRSLLGLSGLGLLCLPQLAVCGKMVRAARDAELPWDKSP